MKFLGEISNYWPIDLLGRNVCKILNLLAIVVNNITIYGNITSVISKWGTFSPFSSLLILLLVRPSNLIVLSIKS